MTTMRRELQRAKGENFTSASDVPSRKSEVFNSPSHEKWDTRLYHQRFILLLFQSVVHPRIHPTRFALTLSSWTFFCLWAAFWHHTFISLAFVVAAVATFFLHFICHYQRQQKSTSRKISRSQRSTIAHFAGKVATLEGFLRSRWEKILHLRQTRPIKVHLDFEQILSLCTKKKTKNTTLPAFFYFSFSPPPFTLVPFGIQANRFCVDR